MSTTSLPRQVARTQRFTLGVPPTSRSGSPSTSPPNRWAAAAVTGGRRTAAGCWPRGWTARRSRSGTSPTHLVLDETTSENLDWHELRFLRQHLGATAPART